MPEFADIIEPAAVTWWPPAWGWWLVALIAIVMIAAVIALVTLWFRHRRIVAMTRPLLTEALERYRKEENSEVFCRDLNQTLKRYIAYQHPQSALLARTGYEWTDALTQIADIFSDDTIQALAQGPYRPTERLRPEQHAVEVREWCARCSISALKKWSATTTIKGSGHA